MKRIILASASPRRRELLSIIEPDFEVIVSDADEKTNRQLPNEVVDDLSFLKAENVYRILMDKNVNNVFKEQTIIIGADTVVAVDGEILGKPADEENAYNMLKKLQGRTHEVYTGVTVISVDGNSKKTITFNELTQVSFYSMTDEEIREYIATKDPMDKAGAYGIQSGAAVYVEKINGDYNNVVGLPVARLYHVLKSM